MTADRSIWLVRATDVGLDVFRDEGLVALNCKVRQSVVGLSEEEIAAVGSSRRHSRELARILHVNPGALVVATDRNRPDVVLVGTVDDLYDFRPDVVDGHPHVLPVSWGGIVARKVLRDEELRWPGLDVLAIAELDASPGAADIIARAAAGENFVRQSRSSRTSSPRAEKAAPVRRRAVGVSGEDLLAAVPRRLGRPASWVDSALDEPAVPCPAARCDHHTRHRYWLPIKLPQPRVDGPNLLVVGVNPTCPDVDHPRNQTYRQVRRLAAGIGAASCGMVNLATRRTADVAELTALEDGELVGPRHHQMLTAALEQADLVVLAYGRLDGARAASLRPQREQLQRLLDIERRQGLVVAQVGEFPSHPWPWSTTVPGDEQALVSVLSAA